MVVFNVELTANNIILQGVINSDVRLHETTSYYSYKSANK